MPRSQMAERRFPPVWLHRHRVHDDNLMGYTVKLTCPGCQRVQGSDPYALWWLLEQRDWYDRMTQVPKRFRCTSYMVIERRVIRPSIRMTDDPPTDDTLRRPTKRDWEKSVRRRRT